MKNIPKSYVSPHKSFYDFIKSNYPDITKKWEKSTKSIHPNYSNYMKKLGQYGKPR